MQRCLALASMAWPRCRPNPMVGAVIVNEGKIIGEGYTQQYGSHHAEVMAINSVADPSLIPTSTLFVSLEPCSHFGNTPPCSNLIIEVGFKRVVVATVDSFSKVSGSGIKALMESGIDVRVGILEEEARKLNKRFFTFHEKRRPYVILKWAESRDGYIDKTRESLTQGPEKITGPEASQLVHQWRSEEQAIMVGGNTVRMDNPFLNVRHVEGINPTRIVISSSGELAPESNIFNEDAKTIIFNSTLEKSEKNVEWMRLDFDSNWIDQMLLCLHKLGIQSILVEGGTETINGFIQSGKYDEVRRFRSKKNLHTGIEAPSVVLPIETTLLVGKDRLDIVKCYN